MSNNALNNSLQRPLKQGAKFSALFSASSCKSIPLGEGDTSYGVDTIKDWILQDVNTIDTKIARKLFLGKTVEETVSKIHSFLYNNFQYKADEYMQNLRSVNCSWAQRESGIDCKSYTIIASVLLLKCGINHRLRRIKQYGFSPEEYTHIYAIVPKNQNDNTLESGYYVVDGTIPTMHEPNYLQQKDVIMNLPYQGLKGVSLSQKVREQQRVFIKGIAPFISVENKLKINTYISNLIEAGITPVYSKYSRGFKINDLEIPLIHGLNGTGNEDEDTGGILSNVDYAELYDSVGGDDFLDGIIGDIFPDGIFNFGCYGASFPPSKAIEDWTPARIKNVLDFLTENITHQSFYEFQMAANVVIGCARRKADYFSGCSEDGGKAATKAMLGFYDDFMKNIKEIYPIEVIEENVLPDIEMLKNSANIPNGFLSSMDGYSRIKARISKHPQFFRFTRYKVVGDGSFEIETGSGGTGTGSGGTETGSGGTETGAETGTINTPTVKKSGTGKLFGGLLLLAAAGYAYKEYYTNNQKK